MSAIMKSSASSLSKLAQLPRYLHPANLVNEFKKPMLQQNKTINGELQFGQNLYGNESYEALVKSIVSTRKGYRKASVNSRKNLAKQQYGSWNSYLETKHTQLPEQFRINETQKQRIYESMIITKQRNQERLAFNRFIGFFNEYSRGFKFDIQINPLVMMRLTYPHWGYFNLFPATPAYRLKIQEVFQLFQDLAVASIERQQGNSLHSSQILSFIFWKLYSRKYPKDHSPTLSTADFCILLSYFKFNKVNPQNMAQEFSYSIKKGELQNHGDQVRFDLWRQFFLDRNL